MNPRCKITVAWFLFLLTSATFGSSPTVAHEFHIANGTDHSIILPTNYAGDIRLGGGESIDFYLDPSIEIYVDYGFGAGTETLWAAGVTPPQIVKVFITQRADVGEGVIAAQIFAHDVPDAPAAPPDMTADRVYWFGQGFLIVFGSGLLALAARWIKSVIGGGESSAE